MIKRALFLIGYALILIPLIWFVAMSLHEMCHFQAAEALGYDARVEFNGIFRGVTYYSPTNDVVDYSGFFKEMNEGSFFYPFTLDFNGFLIDLAGGLGAFFVMFPIWLGLRNKVNLSLDLVLGAMTFIQLSYGLAEGIGLDQNTAIIRVIMLATVIIFVAIRIDRMRSKNREKALTREHAIEDVMTCEDLKAEIEPVPAEDVELIENEDAIPWLDDHYL